MLVVEHFVAPSKIHGIGLFAAKRIAKGDVVWTFNPIVDKVIKFEDFQSLPDSTKSWIKKHGEYWDDENQYVLGIDGDLFMNHCEKPNISASKIQCVALRDIDIGEEITCNYFENF